MSLVKKKRTTVSNKDAWESADVVEDYVLDTTLQPPEESILNLLRDQISDMKMLDIGVGAGRTTRHFAELVREYVGIDYSERMISKCNEYLSGFGGNSSFFVNDVRSLEKFRDDEFDFILFSFNGLDNIAHDERLRVLQEISRIGKPGSFFCFSTHNLQYIDHIFDLRHQLTWKPRTMLNRLKRWFAVTFVHNNPLHILSIKNNQYGIFNDGAFAGMTTSKRDHEHHLSMSSKVLWERRPRWIGGSQRGNCTL